MMAAAALHPDRDIRQKVNDRDGPVANTTDKPKLLMPPSLSARRAVGQIVGVENAGPGGKLHKHKLI